MGFKGLAGCQSSQVREIGKVPARQVASPPGSVGENWKRFGQRSQQGHRGRTGFLLLGKGRPRLADTLDEQPCPRLASPMSDMEGKSGESRDVSCSQLSTSSFAMSQQRVRLTLARIPI